ncbi:hypothetical protein [Enhygromyxa salina]|uniref:hypothetical protein n=1 Tax=Enhygromyxa salina TaxID=215803 RepID=UPI00069792E3|nr:hypothetical protein [Enhygromyxa salina]
MSQKELWGLLALGCLAVAAGMAASAIAPSEQSENEFDWEDLFRPGRAHEVQVLRVSKAKHPRSRVLDNPWIEYRDGSRGRPDNVVVDRLGRVERVVEAKDVHRLQSSHVFQTAKYDRALGPTRGSIVAIASRTQVSDRVASLAELMDIKIRRV